ncbi:MAG: Aminopeptidase [Alphaproteobacteria bacterium MarineAlpha5_Bin6]|nr:MAG: Aminopeptidase [Alphaproteobacteria bacterium MarineAlpha5_Bin6]|tara:strand:- start:254 stop:2005 length:1752 start_codon:yes stop_codon:yes gene_type:complete
MKDLKKIQNWMKEEKIDFFILNRSDEFLGEYIAPYADRLKWISNFTGSAGRAIILQDKAIIFVDGRYTFQVREQVDKKCFVVKHIEKYWKWLENNINKKKIIGVDPKIHSIFEINKLASIVKKNKSEISFFSTNPIDFFWKDQPKYPQHSAFLHEIKYAGKTTSQKLKIVCSMLKNESIGCYLFNALDSIAWLLNIRGNDIPFTPFVFCYAIISDDGKINLFIDLKKIKLIKNNLENYINFFPIEKIEYFFEKIDKNIKMGMDIFRTNYYFKNLCQRNNIEIKYLDDPCYYLKSQKNKIEINGAIKANTRDGLSITKFLFWLKNNKKITKHDEISASKYLYDLRKKNRLFFSLSFETISAIDRNAALPHYKITSKSKLSFKKNAIYLIDSGAQYFDGTTDITRTIVIGEPSNEQKDRFTRVLKGHIAIATAEFQFNKKASDLDYLARRSLKKIGCDFDHGTGHGVGSFSNVHEGPFRITKSNKLNDIVLKEGIILSNEPGYYKKNQYGIRIENLIISNKISEKKLAFKTISLAPIDVDLIEKKLLTKKEILWINNYHKKVRQSLSKYLKSKEKQWLNNVTRII